MFDQALRDATSAAPPDRGEALQATSGWQRIPAIHVFFSEPEVPRPMFFQLAYLVSEAPMCGH